MTIVTTTPPDSDIEVIESVNETDMVGNGETAPFTDSPDVPQSPESLGSDKGEAEPVEGSTEPVDAVEDNPAVDEAEKDEPAPDLVQDVVGDDTAQEAPPVPPVQKLYLHVCSFGSCPSRWSKFDSVREEVEALEAEVSKCRIVHRHEWTGDSRWVTASFTVNCSDMRAFLSEALAGYQDLDLDLENWTFKPPYKPLVHRWHRLRELQATWEGPGPAELMTFLDPLLGPSVSALDSTRETGMVEYDALWQLFPPNEVVVTTLWGEPMIGRVVKYTEETNFRITVEFVDWNGDYCGWSEVYYDIEWYNGYRRASSLAVCPISLVPNAEELKSRLLARGRRFAELRGYHFLQYNYVKIRMGDFDEWEEDPVNDRVVVDAHAYYTSNNVVKPVLRRLKGANEQPETQDEEQNEPGSDEADTKPTSRPSSNREVARTEDLSELTEEECLMASPWVIGFELKRKKWGRFAVEKLEEIVWSDAMFDNLVLPGGEKELAWEFVESKIRSNVGFDDFVKDKGRGLIILMFGPPGVGKTYTAEAVAEKARVPLYATSAGMLGTNPETVETTLTHDLELCRLWNAMLLLDEADIFLGDRQDDSLTRNELVSVFLTKLEYYQGILFLTTNRFARIDHAFQSRVDLFLPYRPLEAPARARVWRNFLSRAASSASSGDEAAAGQVQVTDADIERLAELPLNGREIKNLLKSAQLLALRRGTPVTAERLFMLADKRVAALKLLEEHNTIADLKR